MHFSTYGNHHHLLCCSGHTKCACPLLSLWARKILQYPCKDYSTGTLFICWQKLLQKYGFINGMPFYLPISFSYLSLRLTKIRLLFLYLLIAKCLSWHLLKLIPMWSILIIEIDFFFHLWKPFAHFPYVHACTDYRKYIKVDFSSKKGKCIGVAFCIKPFFHLKGNVTVNVDDSMFLRRGRL